MDPRRYMVASLSPQRIGRPPRFSAVHEPCREHCRALVQAFRVWWARIKQRRPPSGKRKLKGIPQTSSSTSSPGSLTKYSRAGGGRRLPEAARMEHQAHQTAGKNEVLCPKGQLRRIHWKKGEVHFQLKRCACTRLIEPYALGLIPRLASSPASIPTDRHSGALEPLSPIHSWGSCAALERSWAAKTLRSAPSFSPPKIRRGDNVLYATSN